MLQRSIDLTDQFNNNGQNVRLDVSNWDYAVLQVQTPSAAINFNGTNDDNAQTGISDGNALMATNFQPVDGLNTATQAYATSTSTNGIFRFSSTSQYLQFVAAAGTTVTKLILSLQKIS